MAKKGDCGGTPRVGKKGDPKPKRGNGRGSGLRSRRSIK
jgi:hypothetical protein